MILDTRLTDGFSANIRLHSFTRSGVSAGGRPCGLPSALARSWQAFMPSLPESESDARRLLEAVRSHWGIENSVRWVLDVSFQEEKSQVRASNAPDNLATMRHGALNLLRQNRRSKISIKAKRKLAAWDNDYLLPILSN